MLSLLLPLLDVLKVHGILPTVVPGLYLGRDPDRGHHCSAGEDVDLGLDERSSGGQSGCEGPEGRSDCNASNGGRHVLSGNIIRQNYYSNQLE